MKSFDIRSVSALLAALLLPVVAVQAQTAPATAPHASPAADNISSDAGQALLRSLDQWRAAVVAGDRAGLEHAYHEQLSYGHTDGEVLGRAPQIDRTLVPGRRFTAVDVTDLVIRRRGELALVTGGFAFHIKRDDGATSVSRLSGLDVWVLENGRWQLLARQLTRPTH